MIKQKKSVGSTIRSILTNDNYGAIILCIIFAIVITLLAPNFLTYRNLINLMRQAVFYLIITMGLLFIFMIGEIDLCVSATMGMSGLVAAMLAKSTLNLPLWLSFVVPVFIGLAVGLLNGFLVGYLKFPSFIATLGTQIMIRGLMLVITGGASVNGLQEGFTWVGTSYILQIPTPIYLLIIIMIVTWFLLNKTPFGRKMTAIGGNEQAAIVSGINTKSVVLWTFVFAEVLAAIAGVALCSRFGTGQLSLGEGYEQYGIAGAVIGGASMSGGHGTVLGVFFGGMVMCILRNGMDLIGMNAYWQQAIQGAIIVLAVLIDIGRKKFRKE